MKEVTRPNKSTDQLPKQSVNTVQKKNKSDLPGNAKDSLIQRSLADQAKSLGSSSGAADSKSKMPANVQAKMENSFGADFSGVNIHEGNSAKEMNAHAYTQGNNIHFAPGQYNPESKSGQQLLGHELTHVVQQRKSNVQPTTQLKGVDINDDKGLEKEADEMGAKAAQGVIINGSGGESNNNTNSNLPIQRFESNEHKALGDAGSSNAKVALSPWFEVSYGDITALAGDWFGSVADITRVANIKGAIAEGKTPEEISGLKRTGEIFSIPGSVDDIKYAVVVGIRGRTDLAKFFSQNVKDSVDKRAMGLLPNNWDHFSNSSTGDKDKAHKDKVNSFDKDKHPLNNATAYRVNHELAIDEAIRAGFTNNSLNKALLYESFSSHFLTDSFAAGHLRVERFSATKYWKDKYPMFWVNVQSWIAEKLTYHIDKNKAVLGGAVTPQVIFESAIETVHEKMKGQPTMSFGDLVSGSMHDYDNEHGVEATSGVSKDIVKMYGDGQLLDDHQKVVAKSLPTFQLATGAIKASRLDIDQAYAKGKAGESNSEVIKNSLLTKDKIYRAEQLFPKALPDSDPAQQSKSLNWNVKTYEELIQSAPMKDAIKLFLGEKIESIRASVSLEKDYQKKAFEEEVLGSLRGDKGIDSIGQIIHYYPGCVAPLGGMGGTDKDENAYDYFMEVKNAKALNTLTDIQRIGLLKAVLDGPVTGNDEIVVSEIINTTPAYQKKSVIDKSGGWKLVYEKLNGDELKSVIEQSRSYWINCSFVEKETEITRLAKGVTNDHAQQAIIVILMTLPKTQIKELGDKHNLTFDLDGVYEKQYEEMIK